MLSSIFHETQHFVYHLLSTFLKDVEISSLKKTKQNNRDFPGGPVDKNLPVKAGDMGLIPCLEKSHMPWCH